jgi:carbamoyltransferase
VRPLSSFRSESGVSLRVLGVNAVFHDPAAALVVDGVTVAAAEEERFTRRKHGKLPVPFSTWELPEQAARWCLESAGVRAQDLDAVAYSYDPGLAPALNGDPTAHAWEGLRTLYAERAPQFLRAALPGLDPGIVAHVPHHVAHAASAALAAPFGGSCDVLVLDGRGEQTSSLAGVYRDGELQILAAQALPHSLGLLYEDATEHLGFMRSSDEYKVMALASYGQPRHLETLRSAVRADGGGYVVEPVVWDELAPHRNGRPLGDADADLAASLQRRLEEVELELIHWLQERTGGRKLAMAGGVALNCVANSRLWTAGPYDDIWVQPAAGDAGTALGAALHVAREAGDEVRPMESAALGRAWSDEQIEACLRQAGARYERSDDVAEEAARVLAANGVVGWFQGASEFGPRALGHRSLLANPADADNLNRLNDIKGREQFRPVAPMVKASRADEIFAGRLPSPYMLFVHVVGREWRERIPAVVHVDGTARAQTVDPGVEPLASRMLDGFERRTGLPVVVNTSFNTAGRPMVDHPRDALECFGSTPIDLLAIGPFVLRREEAA